MHRISTTHFLSVNLSNDGILQYIKEICVFLVCPSSKIKSRFESWILLSSSDINGGKG